MGKTIELNLKNPEWRQNLIVNGNFDFWQRATGSTFSGTGSASGYAWADRWRFSANTTNNRANRQVVLSTDVPTELESGYKSEYSLQYSQTTALTLAASDNLTAVNQKIEGFRYRNLHGNKPMTLSFWFKSTLAGQYPVSFSNNTGTRSYVTLFTYDVANVWQKVYVILNSDNTGTWEFGSSTGLDLRICNDNGATFDAPTLNTWLAGNYVGTSQGIQVQAQSTITYSIAQVSLLPGKQIGVTFSRAAIDYGSELVLCQRYYELGTIRARAAVTSGSIEFPVWFRTTKRAVPTVAEDGGSETPVSPTTVDGFSISSTSAAYTVNWTADAEL